MRTKALLVIAFLVSLAGCTQPAAEVLATSAAPTQVEGLSGNGAIEGTVLDDELLPVGGARVEIIYKGDVAGGQRLQLSTDPSGRFLAEKLAGGEYAIYVDLLGYREPPPKVVVVTEGSTTKIAFELDRIRVYTAYYESVPYRSRSNAFVCSDGCLGWWDDVNLTFSFEIDELQTGPVQTLIHEMKWAATIPACAGGRRVDVFSPEQETINAAALSDKNPFHWTNYPETGSPTHLVIQREGAGPDAMLSPARTDLNEGRPIVTTGKWLFDTFHDHYDPYGLPFAFSCGGDQNVENWVTAFYVAPAPNPDWSAFPE